jgi:hypothetical protein
MKDRKEIKLCKCRMARYCSIQCQHSDWEKHKQVCRDTRKHREAMTKPTSG